MASAFSLLILLMLLVSCHLHGGKAQPGSLSVARYDLAAAAAGNKIVFAGGRYVVPPSRSMVSPAHQLLDCTTCHPSSYYFFCRGALTVFNTVDIYDVITGQWNSTATGAGILSVARYYLAAAATGNKVIFAGG